MQCKGCGLVSTVGADGVCGYCHTKNDIQRQTQLKRPGRGAFATMYIVTALAVVAGQILLGAAIAHAAPWWWSAVAFGVAAIFGVATMIVGVLR